MGRAFLMITLMGILVFAGMLGVAGFFFRVLGWVAVAGFKLFGWLLLAAGFLALLSLSVVFFLPLGAVVLFVVLCVVASHNHAEARS
jgi:membrane-bound ClpP family serine protease